MAPRFHPLEAGLLLSGAASAAWTGDLRPLMVAGGVELAWRLATALRSSAPAPRTEVAAAEQARLRKLDEPTRRRFLELDRLRKHFRKLAAQHPDLADADAERELGKVDELVRDWLELAATRAETAAVVGEAGRAQVEAIGAEMARVETALEEVLATFADLATPEELSARLDGLRQGMRALDRSVRELRALDRAGSKQG